MVPPIVLVIVLAAGATSEAQTKGKRYAVIATVQYYEHSGFRNP